jgi:hypothetical protein
MKHIARWLSTHLDYTPLADREDWEVERHPVVKSLETPAAAWLRVL